MELNPYGDGLFADYYNSNDPVKAGELLDTRVHPDFVDYTPAFGNEPTKEGFKKLLTYIKSAFHEHYVVERTVNEGDVVVGIWKTSLEHVGEFMGVQATGRKFQIRGITAYQLKDGLIIGHWEHFDVPTILGNLGLLK